MMWVRLDNRAVLNPKVSALTDGQFRVWIRMLCYCAANESPMIDEGAMREVVGLTGKVVARFAELRLLDKNGKGYFVHDWTLYSSASLTEKVRAYLTEHPEATANKVARAIPGRRADILAEVKRLRMEGEA